MREPARGLGLLVKEGMEEVSWGTDKPRRLFVASGPLAPRRAVGYAWYIVFPRPISRSW